MATRFTRFDPNQSLSGRFLVTTEHRRTNRVETLAWYRSFCIKNEYSRLGLKLQLFLVLERCRGDESLEPALMEKSRWFSGGSIQRGYSSKI